MIPVNPALDDLEWRWNIGSGSGFHQAGAFIIPTIATGGAGGLAAAPPARGGGQPGPTDLAGQGL